MHTDQEKRYRTFPFADDITVYTQKKFQEIYKNITVVNK